MPQDLVVTLPTYVDDHDYVTGYTTLQDDLVGIDEVPLLSTATLLNRNEELETVMILNDGPHDEGNYFKNAPAVLNFIDDDNLAYLEPNASQQSMTLRVVNVLNADKSETRVKVPDGVKVDELPNVITYESRNGTETGLYISGSYQTVEADRIAAKMIW